MTWDPGLQSAFRNSPNWPSFMRSYGTSCWSASQHSRYNFCKPQVLSQPHTALLMVTQQKKTKGNKCCHVSIWTPKAICRCRCTCHKWLLDLVWPSAPQIPLTSSLFYNGHWSDGVYKVGKQLATLALGYVMLRPSPALRAPSGKLPAQPPVSPCERIWLPLFQEGHKALHTLHV